MKEVQHYVLFPNHDNGMRLYKKLKEEGVGAVIAPTTRSASKCCGISLLVREEDLDRVRRCVEEDRIEILDIAAVERDVDPGRDRYC